MKAVSIQKSKVDQIERKLMQIVGMLKQATKKNVDGVEICSHCGKPIVTKLTQSDKKWVENYRKGKIKGKIYKDFAEFAKATQ